MIKFLLKYPIFGGVLNAFLPGIIYLFVGKRNKFGAFLLLGIVFSFFTATSENMFKSNNLISFFSAFFIIIAFAVDGYSECKEAAKHIEKQ